MGTSDWIVRLGFCLLWLRIGRFLLDLVQGEIDVTIAFIYLLAFHLLNY